MDQLSREDIVEGLSDVVEILARSQRPAGIRIVGGAAIAFWFGDRRLTDDVDARLTPAEDVLAAAETVGRSRGWPSRWLNPDASIFFPDYGETVEWTTIHSADEVVVEIASTRALLAMKLRASRPGRDDDDIARLLALHAIDSIEEAEELHRALPGRRTDGSSTSAARGHPPRRGTGAGSSDASHPGPHEGHRRLIVTAGH
ncbi:hypothetical protein EDF36_2329 [Rathayibacter sp. PhB152]|uniref:hypothetical protein n=1 Tax=Rathayibacter sp. PhB152 TaxID=2485190 RepID=UPI000FAD1109|nr:hypothetical protein [Rathayibacter sp. PhB152]ROQ58877.1 hypothetical protein EDF36_2329 [Rathayibacter sp. PhB152]